MLREAESRKRIRHNLVIHNTHREVRKKRWCGKPGCTASTAARGLGIVASLWPESHGKLKDGQRQSESIFNGRISVLNRRRRCKPR